MKLKTSKKIWIHVDCDSFFAECEILRKPEWKNEFVMVGGEVIVAANYKTKALGIGCGTAVWKAKQILKGRGIYCQGDHKYYGEVSREFLYFLREQTLQVEVFSIDEAFCEITGLPELYNISLEEYVLKLQNDIRKQVGIPVSIGVGHTRIKAKIFSKINKPYGIYIGLGNEKDIFQTLEISQVPFIGKKSQQKLHYKCQNIYDFIELGYWKVYDLLGKNGVNLWLELCGVTATNFVSKKLPLSMSRGRSFNKHITNNKVCLLQHLERNFDHLFEELQSKGMETGGVEIFLRDKQFITTTHRCTLESHSSTRYLLLEKTKLLFKELFDTGIDYRSTGVVFFALKKKSFHQMNIFEKKSLPSDIDEVIYNINKRYGSRKISVGNDFLHAGEGVKQRIFR